MGMIIKCPECGSEDVAPYEGEISQCNCGYIAGSDEFNEGCPICGFKMVECDYDGKVSQCMGCHYLADSSEFIAGTY
jgi:hypothetical protein